jgi:ABC-type phosphate transport system auxiliary subunit
MMPSPLTYWLQQIVIVICLLASILLLTLTPARLVLAPLWPWPVEEVVVVAEDGRSGKRIFVQVDTRSEPRIKDVARDRPLTLVAVERPDRPILYGFVAGIRPEPGAELLAMTTAELGRPRVDWAMPEQAVLVLINADETSTEVPLADIVHLYPPNRMSMQDRIELVWKRLGPGWRERRNPSEASG